jgi:hypothetical protein
MVATQISSTLPQREKQKNLSQHSNFFSICYHPLATYLGNDRPALLLQRIHYWLQNEHSGYLLKDGTKWIYNGYKEIKEQFPWLTIDQIGEYIRHLEKQGWLISARFYKLKRDIGFVTTPSHMQEDNQRKWYRINYQKLLDDTGVDLLNSRSSQPPKRSRRTNLKLSRLQSGLIHKAIWNNPDSSIYKEFQNTSKELSQEREKSLDLINEEANTIIPDFVNPDEVENCHKKITQDNQHPGEDQFFAAPRNVKRSKPTQSDALHGFKSQEERDGFYQELLELGKNKSGVRSPAGWANQILKSVNVGEPCEYLNEYRRGEPVGTCEKQEWEIKPGSPFPDFISYLKRTFEANYMTAEQATEAVFKAMRDVNEARTLWNGYKRRLVNVSDGWKRQEALGVSNAYIPAEVLPEKQVTIEEAAAAIQTLVTNSVQLHELPSAMTNEALPAATEEPELEEEPEEEPEIDVSVVKAQAAQMREHLRSASAMKASMGRAWVRAHEDLLIVQRDGGGQIIDFQFAEEVGDGAKELGKSNLRVTKS